MYTQIQKISLMLFIFLIISIVLLVKWIDSDSVDTNISNTENLEQVIAIDKKDEEIDIV